LAGVVPTVTPSGLPLPVGISLVDISIATDVDIAIFVFAYKSALAPTVFTGNDRAAS